MAGDVQISAGGSLVDSDGNPVDLGAASVTGASVEAAGAVMTSGDQSVDGVKEFLSDPLIPDEDYGASWDAVLEPPTKSALYAKVQSIVGRVTFSNADYTVDPTDAYVAQVGTLSAPRTVTLPAANAVPAGHLLTIADESNTASASNYIAITRAGSDTIVDPGNLNTTKSYTTLGSVTTFIKGPDSRQLRSDGTSKWTVVEAGTRRPYCWWQHDKDLAVPTGVWTPIPWNACYPSSVSGSATGADEFGITPDLQDANTTIAVASNGAVLPQATINVADTTGFASAGYLVITGPPGSGDDTIVSYTGVTATTFTGCNSAYRGGGVGISSGTLATGQVVRQANVEWTYPTGYLWNAIVEVAFDSIATSAYFAVRFRSVDNFFNFPLATKHEVGINISLQHTQVVLQAGIIPTVPMRVEVFQNSGSVKLSKVDNIQAPSLMQAFMSGR